MPKHYVSLPSGRFIRTVDPFYNPPIEDTADALASAGGAALGSAVIPIPGVGAVVGATVGKVVGDVLFKKDDPDLKQALKEAGVSVLGFAKMSKEKKGKVIARAQELKAIKAGTVSSKESKPKKKAKKATKTPKEQTTTKSSSSSLDVKSLLSKLGPELQTQVVKAITKVAGDKTKQKKLVESIAASTKPELSSILKLIKDKALQTQAGSEHAQRTKINKVVRDNTTRQNTILARLEAIDKKLAKKQSKFDAISLAFGIPGSI